MYKMVRPIYLKDKHLYFIVFEQLSLLLDLNHKGGN